MGFPKTKGKGAWVPSGIRPAFQSISTSFMPKSIPSLRTAGLGQRVSSGQLRLPVSKPSSVSRAEDEDGDEVEHEAKEASQRHSGTIPRWVGRGKGRKAIRQQGKGATESVQLDLEEEENHIDHEDTSPSNQVDYEELGFQAPSAKSRAKAIIPKAKKKNNQVGEDQEEPFEDDGDEANDMSAEDLTEVPDVKTAPKLQPVAKYKSGPRHKGGKSSSKGLPEDEDNDDNIIVEEEEVIEDEKDDAANTKKMLLRQIEEMQQQLGEKQSLSVIGRPPNRKGTRPSPKALLASPGMADDEAPATTGGLPKQKGGKMSSKASSSMTGDGELSPGPPPQAATPIGRPPNLRSRLSPRGSSSSSVLARNQELSKGLALQANPQIRDEMLKGGKKSSKASRLPVEKSVVGDALDVEADPPVRPILKKPIRPIQNQKGGKMANSSTTLPEKAGEEDLIHPTHWMRRAPIRPAGAYRVANMSGPDESQANALHAPMETADDDVLSEEADSQLAADRTSGHQSLRGKLAAMPAPTSNKEIDDDEEEVELDKESEVEEKEMQKTEEKEEEVEEQEEKEEEEEEKPEKGNGKVSAPVGFQVLKCPNGHHLIKFTVREAGTQCDKCMREMPRGSQLRGCRRCNYDLCDPCLGLDSVQPALGLGISGKGGSKSSKTLNRWNGIADEDFKLKTPDMSQHMQAPLAAGRLLSNFPTHKGGKMQSKGSDLTPETANKGGKMQFKGSDFPPETATEEVLNVRAQKAWPPIIPLNSKGGKKADGKNSAKAVGSLFKDSKHEEEQKEISQPNIMQAQSVAVSAPSEDGHSLSKAWDATGEAAKDVTSPKVIAPTTQVVPPWQMSAPALDMPPPALVRPASTSAGAGGPAFALASSSSTPPVETTRTPGDAAHPGHAACKRRSDEVDDSADLDVLEDADEEGEEMTDLDALMQVIERPAKAAKPNVDPEPSGPFSSATQAVGTSVSAPRYTNPPATSLAQLTGVPGSSSREPLPIPLSKQNALDSSGRAPVPLPTDRSNKRSLVQEDQTPSERQDMEHRKRPRLQTDEPVEEDSHVDERADWDPYITSTCGSGAEDGVEADPSDIVEKALRDLERFEAEAGLIAPPTVLASSSKARREDQRVVGNDAAIGDSKRTADQQPSAVNISSPEKIDAHIIDEMINAAAQAADVELPSPQVMPAAEPPPPARAAAVRPSSPSMELPLPPVVAAVELPLPKTVAAPRSGTLPPPERTPPWPPVPASPAEEFPPRPPEFLPRPPAADMHHQTSPSAAVNNADVTLKASGEPSRNRAAAAVKPLIPRGVALPIEAVPPEIARERSHKDAQNAVEPALKTTDRYLQSQNRAHGPAKADSSNALAKLELRRQFTETQAALRKSQARTEVEEQSNAGSWASTPSSSSKPAVAPGRVELAGTASQAQVNQRKSDDPTSDKLLFDGQRLHRAATSDASQKFDSTSTMQAGDKDLGKYILFVDELKTLVRPDVAPLETDCEVFAGNLPVKQYTPSQIRKWVEHYGAIADICILKDNETAEPSGYAYIRFKHHAGAVKFIDKHKSSKTADSIKAAWSESERLLQGQDGVYRADVEASFDQVVGTSDAKDLWMLSEKGTGNTYAPKPQFKQLHFSAMCTAEQFTNLRSLLVGALAAFHEEASVNLQTEKSNEAATARPGSVPEALKASVQKAPEILSVHAIEVQIQNVREVSKCIIPGKSNHEEFEEIYNYFSNHLQFFIDASTRFGSSHHLAPVLGSKINAYWEEVESLREKITPRECADGADSNGAGGTGADGDASTLQGAPQQFEQWDSGRTSQGMPTAAAAWPSWWTGSASWA